MSHRGDRDREFSDYVASRRDRLLRTAWLLCGDREHITRAEIRQPNRSGSFGVDGWSTVEQKIGWTNPGEGGQGLVTVGVRTSFDFDCGGHYSTGPLTTCTDDVLAGLPVTRIDDQDFGESIAYRRPDGYVTTIATDSLFGNNSTVAVSGIDVTDEQLVAVLTDPVLDIPGHPEPVVTTSLSGEEVRDRVRPVLGDRVVGFETWTGSAIGSWWADVRGTGDREGVVSEVMVEDGVGNDAVDEPCDPSFATRCAVRTVGGRTVRIDHRRNDTGGGFDVTYDGEVRTIWVAVDTDGKGRTAISVDDAVALATREAFQG